MDFVNKKVMHKTFGKGNVINFNDLYILINFESGDKKFCFPDAFKKYITFIDPKAAEIVNKRLEKKEEKEKVEESILKIEKALEQEQQAILNQRKRMKNVKVHPKIQSVFWCEPNEEDEIFTEWKVFTEKIKSGKKKGEPRIFARMNQNSACLLTKIEDNTKEEDRRILGMFMVDKDFDSRLCKDGYITAHSKYKIRLSEEESKKMLFWNYYADEKDSNKTVWNSGRQRYFDNICMAQILRDIIELRENSEEQNDAQVFFNYFCKINLIDKDELPKANGALTCTQN